MLAQEGRIRVLLVDDEEDLLDIGQAYLVRSGIDVETASSGRSALDIMDLHPFDAVVSDYQMPRMDGIQLLQEVRSRFGNMPFILFTGRGREDVVIQALDGGADSYLQKGGAPDPQFTELAHRVHQAVERRKAISELRDSEARLRRAEIMAHLGHWEIDLASKRLIASEGASAIYGTELRDTDLKVAQAFVLDEFRPTMDKALRDLIEHGTPYDVRFKVRRESDGVVVEVHSWAEFDRQRGRVFGVFQEVIGRNSK